MMMIPATTPKPPIIDADFDEAMRGLLAVKPPLSGKKAKARQNRRLKKHGPKTRTGC